MGTKTSKKVAPPAKQRFPITLSLIILVGVALVAVALMEGGNNQSGSTAAPQVSGAPALQVDQAKIDLGDVPLGQTVSAKFEVVNVGDQPLRFKEKPYVEVVEGC